MRKLAALAFAGLLLAGCTTLNALTGASSVPVSVTTYEGATTALDLVTKETDVAVNTVTLSKGTLQEIETLNDAVHAEWLKVKAQHDAGQPMTFDALNAAINAFTAYAAKNGVN